MGLEDRACVFGRVKIWYTDLEYSLPNAVASKPSDVYDPAMTYYKDVWIRKRSQRSLY
jgi:hypothetical protein